MQVINVEPPIQIDAIITEDEVGFYSIVDNSIVKHSLLIDGIPIKDDEKTNVKILRRIMKRIMK